MLYALSWFLVFVILAAWSFGVWLLHSALTWSMSGVGALADQAQHLEGLALPVWASAWLPADLVFAVRAGLVSGLPWMESAVSAIPSATAWLDPLAWILWGIGFLMLGLVGMLLHALIMVTRRAARPMVKKSSPLAP